MKKIVCAAVAAVMAVSLLPGCGKKDKTDYYMKGFDEVKEGRYEEALKDFQTAAKSGDDQAQKAADIVSGYLNAQEAFALGDAEGAKAFLKDIPADYKYYAIGTDIDALRQKVYSENGIDQEPSNTPKPSAAPEPTKTAVPSATPSAGKKENEKDFSRREEVDLELQEIRTLVADGYLDQAEERLDGLKSVTLTDGQKKKANQYREDLQEKRKGQKTETKEDKAFTAEKAIQFVKKQYKLEGDVGDGLAPLYDAQGKKYYALTIQTSKDGKTEILTLHVYGDGTIEIMDRQ